MSKDKYIDIYTGKSRPPRKKKNGKKIKKVLILIFSILFLLSSVVGVSYFIFMYVTSPVKDVDVLGVKDKTDHSITLYWNPINNIDGYKLYVKRDPDDSNVSEIKMVGNVNIYTIDNLKQSEEYEFSIVAYDKTSESRNKKAVKAKTLPNAPLIKEISSNSPGSVSIKWDKNNKASGYIIEFMSTKTHKKSGENKVNINDKNICSHEIKGFEPGETCFIRMFCVSYGEDGSKNISNASERKSIVISEKKK